MTVELLTISIGVGLVVSLIVSETIGRGAGGLIVPGYAALHLTQPLDIALTLLAALCTYGIVRGLSSYLIVYGKRRTVMMILTGFLLGAAFSMAAERFAPVDGSLEMAVIGFIIPGLIAIWFDRQGVLDTCTTTVTAAVATRLILILCASSQLELWELEHQPAPPAQVEAEVVPVAPVPAPLSELTARETP